MSILENKSALTWAFDEYIDAKTDFDGNQCFIAIREISNLIQILVQNPEYYVNGDKTILEEYNNILTNLISPDIIDIEEDNYYLVFNNTNNNLKENNNNTLNKNKNVMLFYTFCVDIGKHSKKELIIVLELLVISLHKNITNYELICFTNFEIKDPSLEKYNITYRKYYDNSIIDLFQSKWLNLSFNKINIYKDLYDEYKKDFIWIDLDTIIAADISYINNLSNVFIENGGNCTYNNVLFDNNKSIVVPRNRYIQGNFWKIDLNLYNKLMNTFKELQDKKLILRYDLQDLFSYYIYIEHQGKLNNINIIGYNVKKESINGLGLWVKEGKIHPKINGLNNLYYDNKKLRTTLYKEKEIHILSFTFKSIKIMYNNKKFEDLFRKS